MPYQSAADTGDARDNTVYFRSTGGSLISTFPGQGLRYPMAKQRRAFNTRLLLSTVGVGRKTVFFRKRQTIYAQGNGSDALFVIQEGMVRVSVKSQTGKETTLTILSDEDFVGEDSMAGPSCRTGSDRAMTDCCLLRIDKKAIMLALKRNKKLANMFLAYALARNVRYEQV
jgi:CRP-like cAMP-binding protein